MEPQAYITYHVPAMQEKRSRWISYYGTHWSKPSGFVPGRKSFLSPILYFSWSFLGASLSRGVGILYCRRYWSAFDGRYVCPYSYAFAYLYHSGAARSRAWRVNRDGHDWSMAGAGRGMETMVTSLRAGETNLQVRRVVISGYYGFRNSGDEAVLKSILFALEEEGAEQGVQIVPIVLSADPAGRAEMYGVESVHRMRLRRNCCGRFAAATASSAAAEACCRMRQARRRSRITRACLKLAQLLGKPTFIYAQGIGPVNRRWMDRLIRGVMRRSAYVSVRDEESAAAAWADGRAAGPDRCCTRSGHGAAAAGSAAACGRSRCGGRPWPWAAAMPAAARADDAPPAAAERCRWSACPCATGARTAPTWRAPPTR